MKTLFGIAIIQLISIVNSLAQCEISSSVIGPAPQSNIAKQRSDRPFPNQTQYVREADVMWSKRIWRVIDLREKMNLPLYYPEQPTHNLVSLFDVLKCAVLNNQLQAFSNPIFDDEFTTPMTQEQVQHLLVEWDSLHEIEDVNNLGQYIRSPIKKEITAVNIRQYWIKEDWCFDKQRSVMECKIIGICPLSEKKLESGEIIGVKPLFWIYFPDARPFLAKSPVFNRRNDAERMSFDELFTKRMFASYIYKESNVYDRTIAEYKSGINALLESEGIGENIFNYESDLWHY